jgi:hypothetical protein
VELRWAARSEGVCHLEDLLLRRTRLGHILPHGGENILPFVKQICLAELHWNESQWQQELADYQSLITRCYSLPSIESIPDWRAILSDVRINQKLHALDGRNKKIRNSSILAGVIISSAAIIALVWHDNKLSKKG